MWVIIMFLNNKFFLQGLVSPKLLFPKTHDPPSVFFPPLYTHIDGYNQPSKRNYLVVILTTFLPCNQLFGLTCLLDALNMSICYY